MSDIERQGPNTTELGERLKNLFNYLLGLKKENGKLVDSGAVREGEYSRYELAGYTNDLVILYPGSRVLLLERGQPYPIRGFFPEIVVVEIDPSSIVEEVSRRGYWRKGIFSLNSREDREGKFPGWLSFPVSIPPDALIGESNAFPSISLWGLYDENGKVRGVSLSLSLSGDKRYRDLRLVCLIEDEGRLVPTSDESLNLFGKLGISVGEEPSLGVDSIFFDFKVSGIGRQHKVSCRIPREIDYGRVFSDLKEKLKAPFPPGFFFDRVRIVS